MNTQPSPTLSLTKDRAAVHAENERMARDDAELKDLKSQRPYFVRRVESANDLNRSQRRYDLHMHDRRIAMKTKMIESYLKRINAAY